MPAVTVIPLTYNAVYAVQGGGSTVLIDTGPDYRGAFDAILSALGGRLPDLVVATHAHLDHAGLGARWQERGVPVAAGQADLAHCVAPQFRDPAEVAAMTAWVRGIGAPPDVVAEAEAGLKRRHASASKEADRDEYPPGGPNPRWPTGLRFEPFTPLAGLSDGDGLPAGLRVVAAPGHTPGNLVVVHGGEGWLFSGDQLLPDITPTPAVQFVRDQRFASLPAFLGSLESLRNGRFEHCYPGHGEPFVSVEAKVAANIDQIEQRTAKVRVDLAAAGPSTVYALAERMYRRALQRRFWQIASTVQGHLDLLVARGQASEEGFEYRAG